MTSDVQLTPQGTPRRTVQPIPTLRPEDVQTQSLRSIRTPSLTGLQASSNAIDISTRNLQNFREGLRINTNLLLQEERERQKKEEEERNSILEAQAEMQLESLMSGNFADIDLQIASNVAGAADASGGIPSVTAELLEETTAGLEQGTPDGPVRLTVRDITNIKASPILEKQQFALIQKEQEEAQKNIREAASVNEQDAYRYAAPETFSQDLAGSTAQLKYDELVDARTDLTAGEKMLLKHEMRKGVRESATLQYIVRSGSPAASALSVIQGETGIDAIDNLPMDEKFNIFNKAMQIENFYLSQESRREAQIEENRLRNRTDMIIDLYSNPEDPANAEMLEYLLNSAQDPSEVNQARGIQQDINEIRDAPFTESDAQLVDALDIAIMTGAMNERDLKEVFVQTAGQAKFNRDVRNDLLAQAARNNDLSRFQDQISFLELKAETIFPKAFEKGDPLANALAVISGGEVKKGTPEEERQKNLYTSMRIEFRDNILGGKYTSEQEAMEDLNKIFESYKARVTGEKSSSAARSVLDYEIDSLTPAEQNQWRVYSSNEDLVTKVNNKYLNNPALIDRDVESGVLSYEEAGAITILLLPKVRGEND